MPSTPLARQGRTPRYIYVLVDKLLRSAAKGVAPIFSAVLPTNATSSGQRVIGAYGRLAHKERCWLVNILRVFLLAAVPASLLLFSVLSFVVHFLGRRPSEEYIPFAGSNEFEKFQNQHSRPGVSLVAACQNHLHPLSASVPHWLSLLDQKKINEVVLVDWASNLGDGEDILSSLPIARRGLDSVRLVRLSGHVDWCAARAYVLGASLALYDVIALVDCGYRGQPPVLDFATFAAKDVSAWFQDPVSLAETESGPSMLRRHAFQAVGGYDERLCSSFATRRPDRDMHVRLTAAGLTASHSHGGGRESKAAMIVSDQVSLGRFRLKESVAMALLRKHYPTRASKASSFRIEAMDEAFFSESSPVRVPSVLSVGRRVCNITEVIRPGLLESAWLTELGMELHNSFSVPWELIDLLSVSKRELLRERLEVRHLRKKNDLLSSYSSSVSQSELLEQVSDARPRLMVVHVMHGLGNRIRSLTSAMAFAESSGRELVVVWERDKHCRALFADLFGSKLKASEHEMIVLDQFPVTWETLRTSGHIDAAWREWIMYNYMATEGLGAVKDAPIVHDKAKHIYFKSAYVLVPTDKGLTGWDLAVAQLNRLQPVSAVRGMVDSVLSRMDGARTVGVHIRNMKLSDEHGIDAVSEYGQNDADVLSYWRGLTQPEAFYSEMTSIVAENPSAQFFLATDSSNIVRRTTGRFPGRVLVVENHTCDDRSSKCLQIALADMIILGRTSLVLGSPWSSFTEGASRFGCKKVLTAGMDFAVPSAENELGLSPAIVAMLKRVREKRARSKRVRG